uniref:Cadherin domain-containing protein n=1 Tax=Trichobilharzia regenti TaxID=157069 RepID=A0AA85K4L0_TRIRE|nr:unnamed protein product [Trichobilharzia regenti]
MVKCFRIDRRTGDLYTTNEAKHLLDSEKLCMNHQNNNNKLISSGVYASTRMSYHHYCTVNLLISINNRILITINVQIEDVNDNAPILPDYNLQRIFINETSLPEVTRVSLKPAYDADFNGYNQLYYYISIVNDNSNNINDLHVDINPFRIEYRSQLNGSNMSDDLNLILTKSLDYESQSEYKMNLTVCDGDRKTKHTIVHCSSQMLLISVNNINDELPWFQVTNYTAVIKETTPISSDIIKVTAKDNDASPYNEIYYRILPSSDSLLVFNSQELFQIQPRTGVISLAKAFPKPGEYKFLVQAVDNADTDDYDTSVNNSTGDTHRLTKGVTYEAVNNAHSNIASVAIQVVDVNNHAPRIEIQQTHDSLLYYSNPSPTAPPPPLKSMNGNYSKFILLNISENVPINTPIAYFKITDEDQLKNAETTCKLIRSSDGEPFLYARNDNSYQADLFFKLIPVNRISEHVSIQKLILVRQLDAEDLYEDLLLKEVEPTLKLESNIAGYLGILLVCSDFGTPKLSTSMPIIIAVNDVNEFYPSIEVIKSSTYSSVVFKSYFNQTYIYDVNITENIPIGSQIVQLIATDKDIKAVIEFVQSTKLKTPFIIDKSKGVLKTTAEIDYEYTTNYKVIIHVHDMKPPELLSLTTTVMLNIFIEDMNDNPPEFITPPPSEIQFDGYTVVEPIRKYQNSLKIIEFEEETIHTKPLGRVRAVDRDSGRNAEIIYFIAEISTDLESDQLNRQKFISWNKAFSNFSSLPKILIDADGALWCEGKLDREKIPIIDLVIGAHDLGEPKLTSYTKVRIILKDINDNQPEWQFPTEVDFLVAVSKSVPIGTIITRVRATDKDEQSKNGLVNYYIADLDGDNEISSKSQLLTGKLIPHIFEMDAKSGELRVKQSLTDLPNGFLEIILKAEDNGRTPQKSFAKLILYITNDSDLLNMNTPKKLLAFYQKEKHTKLLNSQLLTFAKFNEIIPSLMNSDSGSLYISRTVGQQDPESVKHLSIVIGASIIGAIIVICLIALLIGLKFTTRFQNRSKFISATKMNKNDYDPRKIESANSCIKQISHHSCISSDIPVETPNDSNSIHSLMKGIHHTHKIEINDSNTEKLFSPSFNENYFRCSPTSIQTSIPVSMIRTPEDIHYLPIHSALDLTENIPLRLLHVSTNDKFTESQCSNSNTFHKNNENNDTSDNTNNNIDSSTNELVTPHSLTIIASVVPTCNIKTALLPILSQDHCSE